MEKLVWVPIVISFGKDQFILPCNFFGKGLLVFSFRFNEVDLSGNHP